MPLHLRLWLGTFSVREIQSITCHVTCQHACVFPYWGLRNSEMQAKSKSFPHEICWWRSYKHWLIQQQFSHRMSEQHIIGLQYRLLGHWFQHHFPKCYTFYGDFIWKHADFQNAWVPEMNIVNHMRKRRIYIPTEYKQHTKIHTCR